MGSDAPRGIPAMVPKNDALDTGVDRGSVVAGRDRMPIATPFARPSPTVQQSRLIQHPLVERTIGPLILMVVCPPAALILWVIVTRYDGSTIAYLRDLPNHWVVRSLPTPSLWAAGLVAAWTAFQWALLAFLPGPTIAGPVTPQGATPLYKKNGVLAWVVTHALLGLGFATVLSGRTFYARFGELLATLGAGAFVLCAFLYAKALIAPNSPDRARSSNVIYDFFMGIELHPTLWGTSVKQLVNCRVSMMGWSAIVVSFCAYQIEALGALSPALAASAFILITYLLKFFVWETGYFASLDVMHDRFGFYICWGVMAWVPAVYTIAQLYLVTHPTAISWWAAAIAVLFGLTAIAVNYAADEQRQRVRQTGGQCRIWGATPEVIRAPYRCRDGTVRENLLLVSGYWRIARHVHYVAEISTALAWSITAGFSHAVPYFYLFFLTVLLFHRAYRDDVRCAEKYGSAWDEYRRRVPYRIIPGFY